MSWKGYAQDLGGAQPIGSTSFVSDSVPGREDGLCGAPGTSSQQPGHQPALHERLRHGFPSDVSSYTAASLVAGTGTTNDPQYSDQYVAKHFPFPWFASLTGGGTGNPMGTPFTEPQASAGGGTNCDSNHIANLDDPNHGLIHDLNANTVPQFSWITPNNCSDAHDTTCKGNNLSGAFGLRQWAPCRSGQPQRPDLQPAGLPADDPEATTPQELHRRALRLGPVPGVLRSAHRAVLGLRQRGLIDITFDEGEPSFTYSGNSFNNVLTNSSVVSGTPAMPAGQGTSSPQARPRLTLRPTGRPVRPRPGADSIFGAYGISATRPARTSAAPTSTTSRPARTRRWGRTVPETSCTRVRDTTSSSTGRRSAPRPRRRWCLPTACPASSGVTRAAAPAPAPTPSPAAVDEHHHVPHAHQRQPLAGR